MGSHQPRGPRSGIEIDTAALRQARLDAGLSLAQVARADLSRQAVHLIETGKIRPTMRSLSIIAARLGVSETDLLAPPAPLADERAIAQLDLLSQRQEHAQVVERALPLTTLEGPPEVVAFGHHYAGQALYLLTRPSEALPHLRAARARFEALDSPDWAAESMDWEAMTLHLLHDESALRRCRQALRRYRCVETRRPETEARMLEHIGTIHLGRREFARGKASYEAALEVEGGLRELVRIARVYHGLGMCHYGMDRLGPAAELMSKAITLYEAEQRIAHAPLRMGLMMAENDLGLVVMKQGDQARAEELLRSALAHYEAAGIQRLQGHVLLSLGELRHRQGRTDEALELVVQAVQRAAACGETRSVAAGYRQLGELYAERGDQHLADASFQRALGMLQEAGLEEPARECMRAYERVLAERRRTRRRARTASA